MATASTGRAGRLDPDELAGLEEQRDFLLRSIEDLDSEHAAGDLDTVDYETLRGEYTARAAEVIRQIDSRKAGFEAARRDRNPRRSLAVAAGVVLFAAVAGWAVARSMGAREAGDTITGGVNVKQSASQRAQECIQEISPTSPSQAVSCFRAVLDDDPRNPVANTWLGWQIALTSGLVEGDEATQLADAAEQLVERAIEVDPDYSYARAFRAVLAYRRGDYLAARQYLKDFEAGNPSPDARSVIEQQQLGDKIEQALAGSSGEASTSVPASTSSPASTSTTAAGSTRPGG